MAYPTELRERVLAFYDEGLPTARIALNLRVSTAWCRRLKQFRGRPRPRNGGGTFALDADACAHLERFVRERPDATLVELQRRIATELDIRVSIGALWNTLRRLKLTLKKSR